MATAEMMMGTPTAVLINEALEIVKVYTDEGNGAAVRFVNKVLDNISKNIER
jgi:transcription termination factor NusB